MKEWIKPPHQQRVGIFLTGLTSLLVLGLLFWFNSKNCKWRNSLTWHHSMRSFESCAQTKQNKQRKVNTVAPKLLPIERPACRLGPWLTSGNLTGKHFPKTPTYLWGVWNFGTCYHSASVTSPLPPQKKNIGCWFFNELPLWVITLHTLSQLTAGGMTCVYCDSTGTGLLEFVPGFLRPWPWTIILCSSRLISFHCDKS